MWVIRIWFFCVVKPFPTNSLPLPPGSSSASTQRGRQPEFDGMGLDGMGWDGVSKVSFNFLYTLWVYRSCICILIYIVKSCPHKFLVGLKCWSSWGSGCKNSKTPSRWDFLKIVLKVDLQISPNMRGLFAKNSPFFIFWVCSVVKGFSYKIEVH